MRRWREDRLELLLKGALAVGVALVATALALWAGVVWWGW